MIKFNFPRSEKERNRIDVYTFTTSIQMQGSIQIPSQQPQIPEKIEEFLKRSKFNNIRIKDNTISAERGKPIWSYFGIGDPRKCFHTLDITIRDGDLFLFEKLKIAPYMHASTGDIDVFESEMEMFEYFLRTGEWDDSFVIKSNARRRKCDMLVPLYLIALGVAVGLKIGLGILF